MFMSGSGLVRRWVLVVVAAAVVSAGCAEYFRGLGDSIDDCGCPRLAELVGSIDWTGDGTEPARVLFVLGEDPKPLHVSAFWDDVTDEGVYQAAVAKMTAAGYVPVDVDDWGPRSTVFETDTWRLHVVYSGGSDTITFVVWMVEPDERAEEYLAPLVDIYGLRE